jgi:hypothetical protein
MLSDEERWEQYLLCKMDAVVDFGFHPSLVEVLGLDFDYKAHEGESLVEGPDGTLWCMECGKKAEGLFPGGERETLADGDPFCEHCMFAMESDDCPDFDDFDDCPDFDDC